MNTSVDQQTHIEKLIQSIEQKVRWGSSDQWSHQDFNELSERIWQETQVKLSATTLKRLWGKVNYQSQPTTNTLNTLAQFAGYQHWRDFVGKHASSTMNEEKQRAKRPSWLSGRGKRLAIALLLPLLILVVFGFNRWANSPVILDSSQITFSSEPVTQGLPNTVIFNYDVSQVPSNQIEIQQSWDPSLRESVSKDHQTYTTTYYYPGYYRAKLLVDGEVMKEHDVYVTSDGWMGLVMDEPIPHYLEGQLQHEGLLSVTPEQLQEQQLLDKESVPWLAYYNVQDFGELSSSNFTLETAIRSDYRGGDAVCQESQIMVMCSQGMFSIPLVIPGCVGTIFFAASEQFLDGKTQDLSAFGCNLSEWQHLRLTVEQQQLSVYRNETLVYQTTFQQDAGKVVGLRYQFRGAGSVDYVRLLDQNQAVVFLDEFED